MSSMERSVKGATKIKLAAPKQKYIEHILQVTRGGEAGVAEIFRILTLRFRDSTWTIAFKALIVAHIMIRDGEPNVTLRYLSSDPRKMGLQGLYQDTIPDGRQLFRNALHAHTSSNEAFILPGGILEHGRQVQTQGQNIHHYSRYIIERASAFGKSKVDYVLNGKGRLKSMSVDKGLLRETEIVQDQVEALLKCDLLTQEMENEITITAFRLLVGDLLVLFQVMNEGTMSVLQNYFVMSRVDANRALNIYRSFNAITESTMKFLAVARQYSAQIRIDVPNLNHAPTSLTSSLEDYLNDPDFETHRRQYIAEQQAKKGLPPDASLALSSPTTQTASAKVTAAPAPKSTNTSTAKPSQPAPTKGPAPDLIDFFDSIEEHQQPMAQDQAQFQQQQQMFSAPTGFPQQAMQNTGNIQQQYTQAPPQLYTQQTGSNPFMQFQQQQQQPQMQPQYTGAAFGGYGPQSPQQLPPNQGGMIMNGTGLDQFGQQPFGNQGPQAQSQSPLQRQATNPFRQSPTTTVTGQTTGQRSGSNPFARSATIPEEGLPAQFTSPFQPQPTYTPSPPPQQQQSPPPMQPQQTGTNPFARTPAPTQSPPPQSGPVFGPAAGSSAAPLVASPTGTTTNPFRQSAFVNQQTGQGWQMGPQDSMGGLERLDTIPIFPRPAGQPQGQQPFQQQQQQTDQSPWQ